METVTLPFYTSHKTVQAGKIVELRPVQTAMEGTPVITDLVVIFPTAEVNGPETTIIRVSAEYVGKHKPQVGGYYVKYADGYESWSAADVFEGGYKPAPRDFKERMDVEQDELDARLRKLQLFLEGDLFNKLPEKDRDLLTTQSKAMATYSLALRDRRTALLTPAVETPTSEPSSPPTLTSEPNPHEGTPPSTPYPETAAAEKADSTEPVNDAAPVAATETAGETFEEPHAVPHTIVVDAPTDTTFK